MNKDRDDRREELEKERVEPISRLEFLEEYRGDPKGVFDAAKEAGLSIEAYAEVRAPASAESPGSTLEWLLYQEGIRTNEHKGIPSTRTENLPDLYPDESGHMEPMARVIRGYLDEVYLDTFITGERAPASLTTLTPDGGWRPTYYEEPIASPEIMAGFNFLDVCAFSRGITSDKYAVRRLNVTSEERKLRATAEGAEPKLAELTRSKTDTKLVNYRGGFSWTDDFISDRDTRLADLTNAVFMIAEDHRIENLVRLGKVVHDAVPSGNTYTVASNTFGGYTHTANRLEYPYWNAFLKTFGNAYRPNIALGTGPAITALELMSMTADGNLTYGSYQQIRGTTVRSLNADGEDMSHGYISETGTDFTNTELFVFPRSKGIVFIFAFNREQDETERFPGAQKTARWFGAKSAFAAYDPASIRNIDFA